MISPFSIRVVLYLPFDGSSRRSWVVSGRCTRVLRTLPLGLLASLVSPVAGSLTGGGGSSGGSGSPVTTLAGSTVPVAASGSSSTSEAGGGSVPVTTGLLEAGLDGGGALLVNAGELLLLDLVLSLGLRVAV